MNKEKKKEINYPMLIISILVLGVLAYGIGWDGILQEIIQKNNAADRFCIDKGFDKYSEIHEEGLVFVTYTQIECKNTDTKEKRIFSTDLKEKCIKYNKWGECLEEDFYYK